MERENTRKIMVGNVQIGGQNKVVIQSMCNTKTKDVTSTVKQILELEKAGCEIIRVACLDIEDAKAIKQIKEQIHIPIVADIHFDYRIALEAIEAGVDKVRINPGNIGSEERVKMVVDKCKEKNINCAVETSLIYYDEKIFKKLDFVMADLKIWNSALHKEYTGVENGKIIQNFKNLNKLNIPIIARTPVIPEINQEIDKISEFLKTLDNVKKYELLPYHPLGRGKARALGREEPLYTIPDKTYMEELSRYAFLR